MINLRLKICGIRLFVHMYRHFEVVVLQGVELDFVYDLVLNLRCLLVLSF